MSSPFVIPEEIELLAFFGAEPVERLVDDGYWCYEVVDQRNIRLRFSFNVFEQSVQTALQVAGASLATIVHEGAQVMSVSGDTLTCRFLYAGGQSTLMLRLDGSISLEWSSLRTA